MKFVSRWLLTVAVIIAGSISLLPGQAHAACQITRTYFLPQTPYIQSNSPTFYSGFGTPPSVKNIVVKTNNDQDCDGKTVYLSVISTADNTPIAAINQLPYKLVNAAQPGSATPDYSVSYNVYSGEEKCVDRDPSDLKKLIQDKGLTKSDFSYLLDKKDSDGKGFTGLYGYLFDDPTYEIISPNHSVVLTPNEYWEVKGIIYSKFGLNDCGYYVRASLDKPSGSIVYSINSNASDPANDYNTGNFLGYMCNLTDGFSSTNDFTTYYNKTGPGIWINSGSPGATNYNSIHFPTCDSKPWKKRSDPTPGSGGSADPTDPCQDKTTGKSIADCYEVLAPVPGISDVIYFEGSNPTSGGAFTLDKLFTAGINIAIGAVSIIALIALIYVGFMFGSINFQGPSADKKKILRERLKNIFIGIMVILGIYVILNTINPDLLKLAPNLSSVTLESLGSLSNNDFQSITGHPKLKKTDYDAMGDKVAQAQGIDRCYMRVILSRESHGDPGAIGCDENVAKDGIPSRKAFVQSLLTYDGTPIPPGTGVTSSFYNYGKQKCLPDKSQPGYGLDWRFSKGIGLTQVTAFPPSYYSASYMSDVQGPNGALWNARKTELQYKAADGSHYTVEQLLDPETNLTAGAKLMKAFLNKCGQDTLRAYKAYASGNCDSTGNFAVTEATIRTQMYNDCKAGNLPQ